MGLALVPPHGWFGVKAGETAKTNTSQPTRNRRMGKTQFGRDLRSCQAILSPQPFKTMNLMCHGLVGDGARPGGPVLKPSSPQLPVPPEPFPRATLTQAELCGDRRKRTPFFDNPADHLGSTQRRCSGILVLVVHP